VADLLLVNDGDLTYAKVRLDDVSVAVGRGQVAIVVGPHHSGKTSLLEAALDILPRTGGEVLIDGRAVHGLSQRMEAFSYLAADAEPMLEARVAVLLDAERELAQAPGALAREYERRLNVSGLRAAARARSRAASASGYCCSAHSCRPSHSCCSTIHSAASTRWNAPSSRRWCSMPHSGARGCC